MFDADGKADEFGGDTAGQQLLLVKLGVGGGGGVDGERLRIADVGEVFEELEGIDEFRAGGGTARDAEDDHRAALAVEVFLVERGLGISGQAGVADPFDGGVGLEVFGDCQGIFAMAVHAQRQGFDALQGDPGVVGSEAGAEVAERTGAHAQDVGERGEGRGQVVAPAETVVGTVRRVEERVFAGGPVEFSGVDDDATDTGAVAAEPFRE